ncbi:DEAD/DEAH box helicase [Aquipuribacter hungaricus]|uniref:Lhr family helicase n=1 Tax=Aquipuribacter hungaricus TaxID=545624 RepID=UPI00361246F1
MARFSPATRDWFGGAFHAPTPAQVGAWDAVSSGEDALVVAPTGSGKTLAAFLWSLDRLAAEPLPEDPQHRCRVLYVSPLKALAVDVERNLRSPLTGIRASAERLGAPVPDITVGVRSGDTPAAERRTLALRPPDVLITTPESLFLVVTSKARESLLGVETVILDEIHAVAGTKRGAHLALTLERLDALLEKPAQRVGLSATVRPVQEVARFQSGGRPVRIVQPPSTKEFDVSVVVPVPDMSDLGTTTGEVVGSAAGEEQRRSIWPHVNERVVDLVAAHTSTLVFTNSRRLAERFTAQVNEEWAERNAPDEDEDATAAPQPRRTPAEVMAQAGTSAGVPPVLARAHHGSVSKEQRALIEDDLKSGRLPAVVATSSLELGIDMGAVDLVVQVESPPSVASGLQRLGRAGHQVGAVSRGVVFPKHKADLVQCAVVVERMVSGQIEALRVLSSPLDVLAQQVVAMCAMDDWTVDDLYALVRRTASFADLARGPFEATLDMLAGRYPSEEFAELRPRLVWDRVTDTLTGRPGAQRLAVTSGGTIPDRGLFGVFLAGSEGAGRRVGELDEEMVYETRVGDVITLGASSWQVQDITRDQVLVTPAPGRPGKLPFWHGDALGRPAELGRAVGAFVRELVRLGPDAARARCATAGLDEWATDNLLAYLGEQKEATGHVPDDRTIVVERFRDELGDWRVCVHSPFGGQVHAPWALALAARFRERHGLDVQAMHGDDGIVLRLPDVEVSGWGGPDDGLGFLGGGLGGGLGGFGGPPGADLGGDGDGGDGATGGGGAGAGGPAWPTAEPVAAPDVAELVVLDAEDVEDVVTQEIGGSALFASRFRECAARALLLPRRQPGRRQPLWQQRQRAASLLDVARRYPAFPIVLETVRECLQDVFDVPGLVTLMREVASGAVRVIEVETSTPSPFARSLLFGYVAQFLYEGDSPLAERRAAALSLDPQLLAELLGRGDGASLRDLLDPESVRTTEAELQRLVDERKARDAEDVADLLRVLGPMSTEEVAARSLEPQRAAEHLAALVAQRRAIEVRLGGRACTAAVEDAARLRDAVGAALPVGLPEAFLVPVPDPVGDLLARHARTHGPFTAAEVASRFGLGVAVAEQALRRLEQAGRITSGAIRPLEAGGSLDVLDFCDAGVLRVLRRRSLAALRQEVEPVTARDLARFLPAWQSVAVPEQAPDPRATRGGPTVRSTSARPARRGSGGVRGVDGLLRVVEQLAGARVPASALEPLVLPARVTDYQPAMLDELTAAGEVLWVGHAPMSGGDGWVSLHAAHTAHLTLPLAAAGETAATTAPGGRTPVAARAAGPAAVPAAGATAGGSDEPGGPADLACPPGGAAADAEVATRVLDLLGSGGAFFFSRLSAAVGGGPGAAGHVAEADLVRVLWDLVWDGKVTNDTLSPLRALVAGGATHRTPAKAPRSRYRRAPRGPGSGGLLAARAATGPPVAAGRWSLVPPAGEDQTARAAAVDEVLLDRYGVLTRGSVVAEEVPGGFAAVYRVLAAMEEAGRIRRGYFVEGLGAAQFATVGAVDRLRAGAGGAEEAAEEPDPWAVEPPAPVGRSGVVDTAAGPPVPQGPPGLVLAATDPANPYGAALPWPEREGHRAGRKAGALVVLVDGNLVLYVERGARTLLTYTDDEALLASGAEALAAAVRAGRLGRVTVTRADGEGVLDASAPVAALLEAAGFRATPRGLRAG